MIDRRGIVDDPTLHQWWPDGRVRPRRWHRASAGSFLEFWRGIVDQQILEVGRLSRGSEDVVVFGCSAADCLYIYSKYQFKFIRVSRDFFLCKEIQSDFNMAWAEPRKTGMQYRRLGNSGLHVSVLGLGGWLTFGGHVENGESPNCSNPFSSYDACTDWYQSSPSPA